MCADSSNVADFLIEGRNPADLALLTINERYTYGDVQTAAKRVASYLAQVGGRPQDRVVLISSNNLFWVACYLGALQAGMICVPLPESTEPANVEFILKTTNSKIALLQARVYAKLNSSFVGCHVLTDRFFPLTPGFTSQQNFAELPEPSAETTAAQAGKDDLAALMFTSGSTGQPRGVMVSHGNIIANTESIIEYLELTSKDRIMAVLPFHYCFGTSLLHTHLRVGGSLVLDSRFLYPDLVLQRMLETECTGFAGVPSHFQILLRKSGLRSKSFPNLRYVQQAGGCLAPQLIRELREALPGTKVFVMYGQTEATARLSYLPPECLETKLGSVGKGIPRVQLKVLNEFGAEVNPGEVGEIVAEGDNVTKGYWGAPDETAASFRNGKLHTGDLATRDSDGFIYIVDRKKNFLKCGGKRVGILEFENRLLEYPCITEVAVEVIPDGVLGEAARAYVVQRMPGCHSFQSCMSSFYKENLPRDLYPKEIVQVGRLPRNSSGKIRRGEIGTRNS